MPCSNINAISDTMQMFDHQHIIQLLGICCQVGAPVWIVMEWARHGELRAYLQSNRDRQEIQGD